jgi:hypothetical protein
MAIYFPPDITAMRGSYQGLVASDVAALANWQAFLQKLYATTTTLHSAGVCVVMAQGTCLGVPDTTAEA